MWRYIGSSRGALVLLVVVPFMILTVLDCTFAPPVRSTHYGIPGKLPAGRVEVGGGFYPAPVGAPFIALSLSDLVQLEAGSNLSPSWVLGFVGLRLTLDRALDNKGFAADLEFGAGAGAGGVLSDDDDASVRWHDLFAYGGYVGAGIGSHLSENGGLFMRGLLQVSKAELIPTTVWGSVLTGVQMTAHDLVNMHIGIGLGGYGNSEQSILPFFLFEFGLSIEFEIFTYERPEPRQEGEPSIVPEVEEKEEQVAPVIDEELEKEETVAVVEKEEESPLAVTPEVPKRPCPPDATIHGSPPPEGFELYCAGHGPRGIAVRRGWYVGYYEDGRKASEGVYLDDARDGRWVFYYGNGKVRLEAGYKAGMKHGRWVFRDRDGVEIRVVEYADDLEVGKE